MMRDSVRFAVGLLMASALTAPAGAAPAGLTAPVPNARELPTTATSHPYVASKHNLVPLDLATVGYEEVETLVSGKANVYDWGADGRPAVKAADVPYATRILVRRPADKAKFSGNVVVELMYDARSADWAMVWGYLAPKTVRDGDVWVGVTLPKSTIALKKFDAVRYADVGFAPPAPLGCKTGEGGDTIEEGLRFDMLAQVAALLKSAATGNPLAGYGPDRRLFMAEQGVDIATYANLFQPLVRLAGGAPTYDGFILKGNQAGVMAKLNHCAQTVPATDARATFRPNGTPMVTLLSPGEVVGSLATQRADSDDKADPYRRYEVAAGNHLDHWSYIGFPSLEDQQKAGVLQGTADWPFTARCTPETRLSVNPVMRYIWGSTVTNLGAWVKNGTPPPRGGRIALKPGPNGTQLVQLDAKGHAVGGVRTVFSDLPTSVDALSAPGPGNCREIGDTYEYGWAYLNSLYGSPQAYTSKARARVDADAKARWLTAGDAAAWKAELAAPVEPPVVPAS